MIIFISNLIYMIPQLKYYYDNKEEILQKRKEYYKQNKDKIN